MTNKELSRKIRNELKASGYTSKDVSIRVKDCGYSTSVWATIKNPTISKSKITSMLKKYDEYERDHATGEILEGGNTYVFVDYEYGVFDEVIKPYLETAENLNNSPEECNKISENIYFINSDYDKKIVDQNPGVFQSRRVGSIEELAEYLYKIDTFNSLCA